MNTNLIFPALADVSQDIAGRIPVELVKAWMDSDRSADAHGRILAPYLRRGTIVCSDSAGLSKLSVGKPLVEVMKLISEPKEVIFSHGSAIGGRAVGTWIADNTQMFYDESIATEAVVGQMLAAQREMQSLQVKVGLGIHHGSVYDIGGGLYGSDADDIEEYTEEETKGGDVAVSKIVLDKLGGASGAVEERGGKFVLRSADIASVVPSGNPYYPAPFPKAFHEAIRSLDASDSDAVATLHRTYARHTTIILVRVFNAPEEHLLDLFMARVAAHVVIRRVAADYGAEVLEAGGSVAILRVASPHEAVPFTHALRSALAEKSFVANIGIAHGEVLLFDRGGGEWNLAGAPVNIASKLAEDTPERGMIFFESTCAEPAKAHAAATPFSVVKSGVTITGISLR